MSETKDTSLETEQLRTLGQIVAAFLERTSVTASELPALIRSVRDAIGNGAAAEPITPEAPAAAPEPAVPIKRSVRPDHIVCLECGSKQKTLRRHLDVAHGLSVEAYRTKWNLPKDYPTVAPAYAAQRSALAKQIGLGRRRADTSEAATVEPAPEAEAKRGRRRRRRAA